MVGVLLVLLGLCSCAASAGSWWQPMTSERIDKGYPFFRWQTSFEEYEIGRRAPVNSMGVVGVPGWPLQQFGHQTYLRYSEFYLYIRLDREGKETKAYLLPGFRQRAVGDYLPGIITEFDDAGVHYEIALLSVPTEAQPVDFIDIKLTNRSAQNATGRLLISLDGAPTLKADGDLIEDRGKPLLVMGGKPEQISVIERPIGLVDLRCTPGGGLPSHVTDTRWRDGWYGMPIEYAFEAEKGKTYQVFLGTDGTPPWHCFGRPYEAWRKVELSAEGDQPRVVDLNYGWNTKPIAHRFVARDVDGDGIIKIASRATPDSRQPAILNAVWVYPADAQVDPEELAQRKPSVQPLHFVACGANGLSWFMDEVSGEDPTFRALSLRYAPELKPGETKRYALKLPAIDRPELMTYCNSYRPYDTDQSWMRNLEPRYPENKTPYGEDVPPGVDPAQYAVYGPKSRSVWAEQLKLARELSAEAAHSAVKSYWDEFLSRRSVFNVPDKELDSLYKSQLIIMMAYLLKWGDQEIYTQMCGPYNYWDMCYRDNSYMIRAWDVAGYHDIARKLCDSLLTPESRTPSSRWEFGQWDDKDDPGMWRSRPSQWDGQGQVLGALADHYLLGNDRKWLAASYPSILRGAKWLELMRDRQKEIAKGPDDMTYGLLPTGELEAGGSGHPFYINAYGIYGMRQAARCADALNKKEDARELRGWADELHAATIRSARKTFVRFNDYCGTLPVDPTNRENTGSWPGASLVYPLELFDPFDPLINGWYGYMEAEGANIGGLMGFPYIMTDYAISYIRRGQPDKFVDLFCAYVDCSSEMLGWCETMDLGYPFKEFEPTRIAPRGCGDMPHGEACSNYIIMLRNLLLHEDGDTLHIAPATPRRWMMQTTPFGVEKAPSYFGDVTYSIAPQSDRKTIKASVRLDKGANTLEKVLLHLRTPSGRGLISVSVNGKPWDAFAGDTIIVGNPSASIEVTAVIR